jgi:glycosyltransferase involved in cell wall biosynthesis
MPRVSVAIPVYNGENYLAHALDSILVQTFTDFELVISDNASTDRTEEICREFMRKDARIRYFRNAQNLGAAPNYNRCIDLAVGEYFKWAAHDDVCLPNYLKLCVNLLDSDDSIVLCHTATRFIDASGATIGDYTLEDNRFASSDPIERFHNTIDQEHWCVSSFGLMRRDVLLNSVKIARHIGSDRNLLADLALQGRIVHIPSVQFLSRDHAERSIRALEIHERGPWFDTANPASGKYLTFRLLLEHIRLLFRRPLAFRDRGRGLFGLFRWGWRTRKMLRREILLIPGLKEILLILGAKKILRIFRAAASALRHNSESHKCAAKDSVGPAST